MKGSETVNNRKIVRVLLFVFACWTALSISPDVLSGFYCRLSPFLMLNFVIAARTWVWFNLIGLTVLTGCLFYKRLFCRYLCPAGFCFDAVGFLSGKKTCRATRSMPKINYLLAVFSLASALFGIPLFAYVDPVVIFNGFMSIFQSSVGSWGILAFSFFPALLVLQLFFPGLWCNKLCPCGGLQDMTYVLQKSIKKHHPETTEFYPARRLMISGGMGVIAGICLPCLWKDTPRIGFKPPTPVSNDNFVALCVRCGSCVSACPTGILQYRRKTDDIRLWLTPVPDYSVGYCLSDCTRCGTVCPSGAIRSFDIRDKKHLVMAKTELDITDCLLRHHQECDRCMASCGYDAVRIGTGESLFDTYPEVNLDKCVGCGACFNICPEQCFVMTPLDS